MRRALVRFPVTGPLLAALAVSVAGFVACGPRAPEVDGLPEVGLRRALILAGSG